jgi:uncharacterized protein involved in tellurium resistance
LRIKEKETHLTLQEHDDDDDDDDDDDIFIFKKYYHRLKSIIFYTFINVLRT